MEHAGENEQQAQAVSPVGQVADEALTDQVSDQLAASLEAPLVGGQELIDPTQEVVLEEEKVKDEIDIQIDLLKDPDWVVRREAAITLGEMGDERCVEPLAAALRDGDWQVREVAIEGIGQIGSPAVEVLLKLLRDWDVRKSAIMALGKIPTQIAGSLPKDRPPRFRCSCSNYFRRKSSPRLVTQRESE